MIHEPQRIALPAVLRQGLVAFREVQGSSHVYRVRDNWKGKTYQLEPWQFFVLEVLPVCSDFAKLASVFEDRFGRRITDAEVEELFTKIEEMKLFGSAAETHPLVAAFYKKMGIQLVLVSAGGGGTTVKSPGNGGNGKGNGGNGHTETHTDPAIGKKEPQGTGQQAYQSVFTTLDFTAEEFTSQNKDIRKLCRMIKMEGCQLRIQAPEDSLEWLNEVLQISDLYDQIVARKPRLSLTDEMTRLKEQTGKLRKTPSGI